MSGSRLIAALTGKSTSPNLTGRKILRSAGKGCGCCPACADNDDKQILREANGPGPGGIALSQPGDRMEVEADRAADSVMHSAAPPTERNISPSTHRASNEVGARPLPNDVRAFFEPRFAHSFSSVRVFHDDSAAQAARQLDANAFTIGRNIVFGAGRWSPGSSEGRRLLAHELAHVVQQENRPALHRTIQRDHCKHDGFKEGGCAGLGMTDSAGDRINFGVDSLIVQLGLKRHFPGKWIGQVYSPPNLRKQAKKFGAIDALKVKEGSSLRLEILEIKSRNLTNGDGGCELGSDEALGYQEALERIRSKMHEVSIRLARKGGYMIPDNEGSRCKAPEAKEKLREAGLNPKDERTMQAWCVFNSIQTRLGAPFTKEFKGIQIEINKDGEPAERAEDAYEVFSWRAGNCGKKTIGRKYMRFQVNKTGGLSYRCDQECVDEKEQEKEYNDEVRFWEALDMVRKEKQRKRADAQDEKRAPDGKVKVPPPDKRPGDQPFFEVSDIEPFEEGAEIPIEGVDAADIVALGIAGTAVLYGLHLAHKKAKSKAEKVLIEKAAKQTINSLAKKGATDFAHKLNKPIQNLGKKAFEKTIDELDDLAKRQAKGIEKKVEKRLAMRVGKAAAKKGLKAGARAVTRAVPYVGTVIAIVKIFGTAEALAAGAELTFGLDESDLSVSGDTKVDAKPKSGKAPDADADLKDTRIELEIDGVPETTGTLDIKADNFKVSGRPAKEGDPVTVDLKYNFKNTTITIRNDGIYKGGSIHLSGSLDIIDSDITIDLPPGTVLEPPKEGEKRVIKGVKVVITKAGKADAKGGGTGGGSGGGGGQGEGEGSGSEGSDKGIPGATSKDKPAADIAKMTEEARQLLTESFKDPNTKKVAEALLSVKGTKPVDEAMVRRLNALKEKLKKHPKVLEEFLKRIQKKPGSDPLNDVIIPLEEALNDAEKQKPPATQTPAPGDATSGTQQTDKPDDKQASTTNKPQPDKSQSTAIGFKSNLPYMRLLRTPDTPETFQKDIDAWLELTLTFPNSEPRIYKFTVKGTHVGPSQKPGRVSPGQELLWEGRYKVTIPDRVYKTADQKYPIHFSDGGQTEEFDYVATRKKGTSKKPGKKERKQ